jgi:hypothetical protein
MPSSWVPDDGAAEDVLDRIAAPTPAWRRRLAGAVGDVVALLSFWLLAGLGLPTALALLTAGAGCTGAVGGIALAAGRYRRRRSLKPGELATAFAWLDPAELQGVSDQADIAEPGDPLTGSLSVRWDALAWVPSPRSVARGAPELAWDWELIARIEKARWTYAVPRHALAVRLRDGRDVVFLVRDPGAAEDRIAAAGVPVGTV